MCNNIYSAKFARVLMKANNKKFGPAIQPQSHRHPIIQPLGWLQ